MVRYRSWLLRPRHTSSGVTLELGNVPDRGGSHGIISDGDSVPELGAEASKPTRLHLTLEPLMPHKQQ